MEETDYLTIYLAGHNKVNAFRNRFKKEAKHPDFVGDGIAVYINKIRKKV